MDYIPSDEILESMLLKHQADILFVRRLVDHIAAFAVGSTKSVTSRRPLTFSDLSAGCLRYIPVVWRIRYARFTFTFPIAVDHAHSPFFVLYLVGPGNCLGLLASKSSPTAVRGQFYGIAAAMGKIGAFVGTWGMLHICLL